MAVTFSQKHGGTANASPLFPRGTWQCRPRSGVPGRARLLSPAIRRGGRGAALRMAVCPRPDRGRSHTSKAPPGTDRRYSLTGDLGASWKTFSLGGCSVRGKPRRAGGWGALECRRSRQVPSEPTSPSRRPLVPAGPCLALVGPRGPKCTRVPSCSSQHLVLQRRGEEACHQGTPNPGRVAWSEGWAPHDRLGGLTQGERRLCKHACVCHVHRQ